MGILWGLQLRCFHRRTRQCATHSSSSWSTQLQAREGPSCPHGLVQQHPPSKLWYHKALANLFSFWEHFKKHTWTAKLWCLPARCIHPIASWFIATSFCSKWGTQKRDLMTHCWWELMHGVWKLLLDTDFIHKYKFRMVVKCANGIECQVYPQFFTYSADYPEK